jgi:hypothetical protein
MVDRNKLFITILDSTGNLMDPLYITCCTAGGADHYPERLYKGIFRVSENAVPSETDYIVWKIQESKVDKIMELRQKSDGGIQYASSDTQYASKNLVSEVVKNTPVASEELKWSNQDPRIEYLYCKRLNIVILRPSETGSIKAGIGYVDNKETFSILTSFEDHRVIDVDEIWDSSWKWIKQPE